MSLSSRYILSQTFKPLLIAILIALLILLTERMVRLLELTLGAKSSMGLLFEMLSYLVPHYLGTAIPIAFFLGIIIAFNKMSLDSEIDALFAAGAGLHQQVRPVMALSLLILVITALLFGYLQPHGRYAFRSLVYQLRNIDLYYLMEEGVFTEIGKHTLMLETLDRNSRYFKQVFIFEDRGKKGMMVVTAQEGTITASEEGQQAILKLKYGRQFQLDSPGLNAGSTWTSDKSANFADFEEVSTPIGSAGSRLFRSRGQDERELTLIELWENLDTPPEDTTRERMTAELHMRLIRIISLPLLPLLAVPFALSRRRSDRFYRIALGLVILIIYNEIVKLGETSVDRGNTTVLIGLWMPFMVFASFCIWCFLRSAFSIRPGILDTLLGYLSRATDHVIHLMRRS